MAGSERGSMEDVRGQIFTVLGTYEVRTYFMILLIVKIAITPVFANEK